MIGNGILAFAVIIVVVIFVYMSLRLKRDNETSVKYVEQYHIELANGFKGNSISIYLNDSLLFNDEVKNDSLKLTINRFADQNALLVVDNYTDKVSTFDLSDKGGTLLLHKDGNNVLLIGR